MSDQDFFAALRKRQDAERATRLAQAKDRAHVEGKEAFSLERFEALYDTTTDLGTLPPLAERQARWEEKYYVGHPDVRSVAAFAALMASLDAQR